MKNVKEELLEEIVNKINIELNSVEELGAVIERISGFISEVDKMSSLSEKTEKALSQAFKDKEVLKNNYTDNRKKHDDINKAMNDAFKKINNQAKELGISINDLPVYKKYLDALGELKKNYERIQSSWNLVAKY